MQSSPRAHEEAREGGRGDDGSEDAGDEDVHRDEHQLGSMEYARRAGAGAGQRRDRTCLAQQPRRNDANDLFLLGTTSEVPIAHFQASNEAPQ